VPVVPGTEGDWERPPFAGAADAEHVWGRGALDDKGSLVALSAAAEALLEDGFAPERTVVFAFGHDEEVLGSGAEAAARLLAARGARPALVLDEGLTILRDALPGVAAPVALVAVAEKGYASFELVAEAEGGHSSLPRRESAISLLAAALGRLTREPLPARRDSPAFAMLDRVAPHASFGMRLVLANRWLFGGLLARQVGREPFGDALLRTTLAPTIVEGGVKENVIPPRARAVVNLRLLPGDTVADVTRELRRRIDDPRVALRALPTPSEASPVSDDSGWGFAQIERALRAVRPEVVVAPGLMVGATDARHFAPISDQVFRFFPVELSRDDTARFHGTNERISKRNLEQAVRVYARLIESAAGAGR
jgi:carboxypeptidase PM20D1